MSDIITIGVIGLGNAGAPILNNLYKANKYKLNLVNDISGLSYDSNNLEFLKKTNKPFVLKHIKG